MSSIFPRSIDLLLCRDPDEKPQNDEDEENPKRFKKRKSMFQIFKSNLERLDVKSPL